MTDRVVHRCQGSKSDGSQCETTTENTGGVPIGLWKCAQHDRGTNWHWTGGSCLTPVGTVSGGGGGSGGCIVATTAIDTPAGTLTIKSDPSLKPGEFKIVCGVCSKCFVSPEVTLDPEFRCSHGLRPARREEFVPTPAPAPTKPDTFNVGDYVRWWPGIDQTEHTRYSDCDVLELCDGRPSKLRIASHGPRWSSVNGLIGHVVAVSYSARIVSIIGGRPPITDPLDVEYDGVKLRHLVRIDGESRAERGGLGRTGFTPAQRAAVSAHWSAQLRAKVEASAAAERERDRVVLDQDADDMPWRTW